MYILQNRHNWRDECNLSWASILSNCPPLVEGRQYHYLMNSILCIRNQHGFILKKIKFLVRTCGIKRTMEICKLPPYRHSSDFFYLFQMIDSFGWTPGIPRPGKEEQKFVSWRLGMTGIILPPLQKVGGAGFGRAGLQVVTSLGNFTELIATTINVH